MIKWQFDKKLADVEVIRIGMTKSSIKGSIPEPMKNVSGKELFLLQLSTNLEVLKDRKSVV